LTEGGSIVDRGPEHTTTGSERMSQARKPAEIQAERFAAAAGAAGCDDDEAAFDRKLKEVALAPQAVVHAPDCAARAAPAHEPAGCTCGAAARSRR
jgi:hypothetical protein